MYLLTNKMSVISSTSQWAAYSRWCITSSVQMKPGDGDMNVLGCLQPNHYARILPTMSPEIPAAHITTMRLLDIEKIYVIRMRHRNCPMWTLQHVRRQGSGFPAKVVGDPKSAHVVLYLASRPGKVRSMSYRACKAQVIGRYSLIGHN